MKHREQGIIKNLLFGIIAIFLLLIVLAVASRYISSGLSGTGSGFGGISTGEYVVRSNPLLPDIPNTGWTSGTGGQGSSGGAATPQPGRSPFAGQVTLSTGNASYSIQPFEEYVSIRNSGNPVSITGWTITNSRGTRPTEMSHNSYIYPSGDSAVIGQGTQFLDPSGRFVVSDIILNSGDTAIITTGPAFSQFPLSIYTSFRENKCVGYLENYPFTPALDSYMCPAPTREPGIETVTEQCYDYLMYVPRCSNPEKSDKQRFDETLSSHCKAFIRERLNYAGCVANHRYDADFNLKQWRVFLGKTRELWNSRRETITLYDRNGLIVSQVSY